MKFPLIIPNLAMLALSLLYEPFTPQLNNKNLAKETIHIISFEPISKKRASKSIH